MAETPEQQRHWETGARPDEIPTVEVSPEGLLRAVNKAIYAVYERADINRRHIAGELDWSEMLEAGVQPDDPDLQKEADLIVEILDLVVPHPSGEGWGDFVDHTYLDRVADEWHQGQQVTE